MAQNVTLKDPATQEPLYPLTTLDNVIDTNGNSVQNIVENLTDYVEDAIDLIDEAATTAVGQIQEAVEGASQATGVISVTAGAGLNTTSNDNASDGGTISSTGTLYLTKSGVTAGSYGPSANVTGNEGTTMSVPQITVDKYGRVTNVANRTYTAKNTTYTIPTGFAYSAITYEYATQSTSGAVSINGSIPFHVITCTGNISSVSLSTNPSTGHSCHVIFTATASRTVAIAHDSTNRICPEAAALSFTVPANGYVEVDFLNINGKVYVRGV